MNGIFQALYQGFNFMTSLPEHIIEPMEFLPEFLKEALIDSLKPYSVFVCNFYIN